MLWNIAFGILLLVAISLTIYTLYLKYKILTGKGRFATTVVFAISAVIPATIIAVANFTLFDNLLSLFNAVSGRSDQVPSYASRSLDYVLIFLLSYVAIRGLVNFGNNTIKNWNGPATRIDALLKDDKEEPNLLPVTLKYIQLRIQGLQDSPIDARTLQDSYRLGEVPPPPDWDHTARDLMLSAFNEIGIDEDAFSDELKAWVGAFSPKFSTQRTPIFAFPVADDSHQTLLDIQARVSTKLDVSPKRIYVCVDDDEFREKSEDAYGFGFVILTKGYLLFESLNFTTYCNYLVKSFKEDRVLGSEFSLEQLFVEPKVFVDGDETNSESLTDLLEKWQASEEKHHLSVVGEFGQGKSTAVLSYCAKWADQWLRGEGRDKRVPLLIPLRGRDPSSLPRADFLAAWGDRFRLSGKGLLSLVHAGKAVLIFEGFDEVNNAGIKQERFAQFDALWKFGSQRSKIIFTGRPNFFIDDEELHRLLRIDDIGEKAGRSATRVVKLAFFEEQQVMAALRPFNSAVAKDIVELFRTDAQFRDVASRPSMLPLIAMIWPTIHKEFESNGRVTSSGVIRKYIDFEYDRKQATVEHDRIASGFTIEQNYLRIPKRIRDFFMMFTANAMAKSRLSNTIAGEGFSQCVKVALPDCEAHFATMQTTQEETSFFQRLRGLHQDRGAEEALERLVSELRATGLLARDVSSGPNNLFFPHKQFYEYYLAQFCCLAVEKSTLSNRKDRLALSVDAARPCVSLRHEYQAIRFFSELSDKSWYNFCFTTKITKLSHLSLVLYLIPAAVANIVLSTNTISIPRIFRGPAIPRGVADALERMLPAISIVGLLTIFSVLVVEFPLLAITIFGFSLIFVAWAVALAGFSFAISDIYFWIYLLGNKAPKEKIKYMHRALGPLTVSLLRITYRTASVRRNYYIDLSSYDADGSTLFGERNN